MYLEWIPISKSLPKESGWYLVSTVLEGTGLKGVISAYYDKEEKRKNFKWLVRTSEFRHLVPMSWKVIAWMPYPPHYEAEHE